MLLIETGTVLLLLLTAFWCPSIGSRWFGRVEDFLKAIAQRRVFSVALVGISALAFRLTILPLVPIPCPGVPDEFGYLLASDTFAHFRLTNPPHPMWIHFENLSEIQQPSYASKYFPAQGLFLAAGQVFFGHPFWGVCISIALMCAAICWMLQGWVSDIWALIGGLLAVIRLGSFSYWSNSYWGGAVAAFGGALVLGALPRVQVGHRIRNALILGIGLAILEASRPYEGLLLSVPVLCVLLYRSFREHQVSWAKSASEILLPLALCGVISTAAMGYYCWRVTGKPWLTPYQVAQDTYYPTPLFAWQPLRKMPHYNHAAFLAGFENWELPIYKGIREHPIGASLVKSAHLWLFFFGPTLTAPFVILIFTLPYAFGWTDISAESRILLSFAAISFFGMLFPLFFNPGYAAPFTAIFYGLIVRALRRVRLFKGTRLITGVAFSRAIAIACLALVGVRAAAKPLHISVYGVRTWYSQDFQLTERVKIESALAAIGGRHLVLVRYPEQGLANVTEWVSNKADIDSSTVIWAHDMGEQQNRELIRYFSDRKIWLMDLTMEPPKLVVCGASAEGVLTRH